MTDLVNDLICGDSLNFTVSLDDYSAADGWVLTYALRGLSKIDLIATSVGTDFQVQADASTTASWLPGRYNWVSYVSKSGQRYTVDQGVLTISPDLSQAIAGYDGRSVAEKALADAESALATFRSTRGRTKRYTIGTRTMEFDSVTEVLEEISYWRMRVNNEQAANSIAQGLGNPRKMFVRFK